ncbi:MAG: choice-of-anchor D domain-containing protein [Verrucomicrobiota bacterium]
MNFTWNFPLRRGITLGLFVGFALAGVASAELLLEVRNENGFYQEMTLVDPATEDCDDFEEPDFITDINFPDTRVGRVSRIQIRLTNTSTRRIVPINIRALDENLQNNVPEFTDSISNALNAGQSTTGFVNFQPFFNGNPNVFPMSTAFLAITWPTPTEQDPNRTTTRVVCLSGQAVPNPGIYITGATNSAARGIEPIENNEQPNEFVSRLNYGLFNISVSSPPRTHFFRLYNLSNSSSLVFFEQPNLTGASEFSISPTSFSSIPPNSFTDFTITFTPGVISGTRTATFRTRTEDEEDPIFQFSLTAQTTQGTSLLEIEATGPAGETDPVPLSDNTSLRLESLTDFGPVDLNTQANLRFEMTNPGFQSIEITEITVSDTSSANPITALHSLVPPFTINAQGGIFGSLFARITPTAVGDFQNTVIVRTDGPIPFDEFRFTVYGQGVDLGGAPVPQMSFFAGGQFITPSNNTSSFGGSINDTQIPVVHRITNIGGPTLTISPPNFSGDAAADLSVQGFSSPVSLDPLETFEFTLIADPSQAGNRQATVNIPTNTAGSPFTFTVNVSGINRPPDRAEAIVDGEGGEPLFVLGIEPGDAPSSRFNRISNGGRAPLLINSITTDSPFFRVEDIPESINAWSGSGNFPSEQFRVVFDPAPNAPGETYSTTVRIETNDPDRPIVTIEVFSSLIDVSRLPYVANFFAGPSEGEFTVWWHAFQGLRHHFQRSNTLGGWQNAFSNPSFGNIRGVQQTFEADENAGRLYIRLNKVPE